MPSFSEVDFTSIPDRFTILLTDPQLVQQAGDIINTALTGVTLPMDMDTK